MDRIGSDELVEVWPEIEVVINEAAKAGVFRRAARLNNSSSMIWQDIADTYSRRVVELLVARLQRLGAPGAKP